MDCQNISRDRLPILPPDQPWQKTRDAVTSIPPPRTEITAPEGAPNVVIILLDDMGFGTCDVFGGPVHMPTAQRLARVGERYNQFHTTALCAPTRAALLTGYNHHTNNMGTIGEMGTAFPGNTSVRPKSVTPLARILRDNGYSTAQFGKCHETPTWESGPFGPFDHWPTSSGFEKFYGFVGCQTNQYHPDLYEGTTRLKMETKEGYHLTEDLADKAIEWLKSQRALTPEKPFFLYFAPGATHSPHQVPREFIERYHGAFDEGWDVLRQRTYENMKSMGIIPPDTDLAPKPDAIRDFDTLSADERRLFARQMEVYAGFAEHTDYHVGRLIDALEELSLLENTAIFYILGDNGASAEGKMTGLFNEHAGINGDTEELSYLLENMDKLGTEDAYNHFAAGWAIALDAPFTWAKQVASDYGGTSNPMIVSYPARIRRPGGLCTAFHHCVDITPTILDITHIPHPSVVDGVVQRELEGVSMAYTFDEETAPSRRTIQYFCVGANYGIYADGWFAGVVSKLPWEPIPIYQSYEEGVWELYHADQDFSLSHNVASQYPEKLAELKTLFEQEAEHYNVFPIDSRGHVVFDSRLAGRPEPAALRHAITFFDRLSGLKEATFPTLKNTSFSITADFEVDDAHCDGVLLCQGGRFGGISLYLKHGIVTFLYNYIGRDYFYLRSPVALSAGKNQAQILFRFDGQSGGDCSLLINGQMCDAGHIEKTARYIISYDETADIGEDTGTPVSPEYTCQTSWFNGRIYGIHIENAL